MPPGAVSPLVALPFEAMDFFTFVLCTCYSSSLERSSANSLPLEPLLSIQQATQMSPGSMHSTPRAAHGAFPLPEGAWTGCALSLGAWPHAPAVWSVPPHIL